MEVKKGAFTMFEQIIAALDVGHSVFASLTPFEFRRVSTCWSHGAAYGNSFSLCIYL